MIIRGTALKAFRMFQTTQRIVNFLNAKQLKTDFKNFKALAIRSKERFSVDVSDVYPCLEDRTESTNFDTHYIYHPAWAARVLAKTKPDKHVDISSTLTFVTLVSAFIKTEFYDYRPAHLKLNNLTSGPADLLKLPFSDASIDSLSCMHVVEHVGLGRYGDPLDYDGDLKAIQELTRVCAKGGNLIFVVPIGAPRIMFNAHRIYSYKQIVSLFPSFELKEFSLVPDGKDGGIIINASEEQSNAQTYGCGCFWFVKK